MPLGQKKRKELHDAQSATSSTHSQVVAPVRAPSTSTRVVEEDNEPPEDEARDEFYIDLKTDVVGIQYYNGLVGAGEEVILRRQPENQYDRNAIQVQNMHRAQVGHIPKRAAGQLAPLMDARMISLEGVIVEGNLLKTSKKKFSLPIILKIFGRSDMRATLEAKLAWATPNQSGFANMRARAISTTGPALAPAPISYNYTGLSQAVPLPLPPSSVAGPSSAGNAKARQEAQLKQQEIIRKHQEALKKQQEAIANAAELKHMLSNLEKVDDEGRRSSLLDSICAVDDILSIPEHPDPPSVANGQLNVNLMKHQKQGLQWCLDHEYPVLPKKPEDKVVQFWKFVKADEPRWINLATRTPTNKAPTLGRGALFADAMGLGKTLTMLALIVATKKDKSKEFSNATLIVVPVSVLSNWEKQIEDHCVPGSLKVCVYYGNQRDMTADQLGKHDIVLTTYQSVTNEHILPSDGPANKKKKLERSLFEVQWKRVVLDEGHTIRNPKTKTTKAMCGLSAERRWVLTGTPIINSPRDLGSILGFLRICQPLDEEDFFKRLVLRPIKDASPAGIELMRALMAHVCIRRTKEMQDSKGNTLVALPPVEMIVVPVTLNDDARALYDEVEELSQQRVNSLLNQGSNATVNSNVLSMLTRMRQLVLHPGLLPRNYVEDLRAMNADPNHDKKPPQVKVTLQVKRKLETRILQAVEDYEECPICFGMLTDPRVTSCSHVFCNACIIEVLSRNPLCPMDRRPLTAADLFEPPPPTDMTQKPFVDEEGEEIEGFRKGSSAKIDQLVHLLKLTPSTEKSLVFSQFTSFLDKIAETLEEQGIPYVRFDGQMSAKRRQETIARFSVPVKESTVPVVPDSPPIRQKRAGRAARPIVLDLNSDGEEENDSDFVAEDSPDEAFEDLMATFTSSQTSKSKGKGKEKATTWDHVPFNTESTSSNPRVMLISLKAGALGLNLTVANNVYLMDPWWQEGIESQAVDRVNRIGQTKPVHVYQLIAENTVESQVINIQNRKKLLVQQAFSGTKRVETQREQKEARLRDLIALFGDRREQASGSQAA